MGIRSRMLVALAAAVLGGGVAASGATAGVEWSPRSYAFTGEQYSEHTFTLPGIEVNCSSATYAGTTPSAPGGSLVFHPTFGSCTAVVFGIPLSASVVANADWRLNYVSGSAFGAIDVETDFLPDAYGDSVEIQVMGLNCLIRLLAQSGLQSGTVDNTFGGIEIDLRLRDIEYTTNAGCYLPNESGNDATYDGGVYVSGVTITDL